jgi:hypothetical protein
MNGCVEGSAAQQIIALKAAYRDRGLSFRYCPQSSMDALKWQAGRKVVDAITLPDGAVRLLERFELVAWAGSINGLIDQLA